MKRYIGQISINQLREIILNSIQKEISKELGILIFSPNQRVFKDLVSIPLQGKSGLDRDNINCPVFPLFNAFNLHGVEKELLRVLATVGESNNRNSLQLEQTENSIMFYEISD